MATPSIAMIPSGYKDGKVYSVLPNSGDGDFTFSRGSAATRVNEQGLVENVQIISPELVSNGDFSQEGSELVTNGDFSNGVNDWTEQLNPNFSVDNGVATIQSTGPNSLIYQTISPSSTNSILKIEVDVASISNGSVRISFAGSQVTTSSLGKQVLYTSSSRTNNKMDLSGNTGETIVINSISVKEVGQNWSLFGEAELTSQGARIYSSSGGQSYIVQSVSPLTTSKSYKFSYEITDSTQGSLKLINVNGVSDFPIPSTIGTHTVYFTADNSSFFVYRNSGVTDVTITNISVKEITDDTDLPRLDYSDGSCPSLLLEPQSTNLLPYSEDFSQWTVAQCTLTSNYGLSPDGTQNSTRAVFTGSGQELRNSLTTTSTTSGSIYIKGTSGETIKFGLRGSEELFTLNGNWQRFERQGTDTANRIGINTYGGSTARDVEVWGAQVEQGSYATSYIPTNGSIATRLADAANNSGNSSLINSTEGVLYTEIAANANDGTNREISINNGTTTDRIQILYTSTSNQILIFYKAQNGATVFTMSETLTDATQFNKIAFKWKANDFALWINGTETDTISSGVTSNADALTKIDFDQFNGNTNFYGKAKALAVYKEALTDAELQELTTI